LNEKAGALTEDEFRKIEESIYEHIPLNGIAIRELLSSLKGIRKEKVWNVLNFLQAERKLILSNEMVKKS
jgi:ATP-dependent DNA helicase RecQ